MTKVLRFRFRGKGTTGYLALADVLAGTPEAFTTASGSMTGTPGSVSHPGRLPHDWRLTFQTRNHLITYVILSYATPIAWLDSEAGWIVPAESYSPTTGKHQSTVRAALTWNRKDYLD